jgi:hypothetical protein
MSTFIARALQEPATAGPAPARAKRSGGAGLDQRSPHDRTKPKAVEAKGRTSPIRAWRAADAGPSHTPQQGSGAAASIAAAGARHPFGGEGGAVPRRSTTERAARMRAIEQAWKDEHARQSKFEDD